MTVATPAGYKAVAKLYNALITGLVLSLVTRRGADDAARFVFGHFRRQHLEKFLPGLKKLGLDGLPDAVACAQYHYFSNALGGVKTEYMPESDTKTWVRYPPPRWIWHGTAACGIPAKVNEAMLHGWHGHNGVSLGNPRLGFVCTGQIVTGQPGLEGYYIDYGHEIGEDERVRFAPDEQCPLFDPAKAPVLDHTSWPRERLDKVERAYAMEYVRSLVPTLLDLFGPEETLSHLGHAARIIGMQFYDDLAALLGIEGTSPEAFAQLLSGIAAAQGETVDVEPQSDGSIRITQTGWRLMQGLDIPAEAYAAWNLLWEGALAAQNRMLHLRSERSGDNLTWLVSA